jgi:hypothetical protein
VKKKKINKNAWSPCTLKHLAPVFRKHDVSFQKDENKKKRPSKIENMREKS